VNRLRHAAGFGLPISLSSFASDTTTEMTPRRSKPGAPPDAGVAPPIEPMLAKLADDIPVGESWVDEP
jgi:hypothetical protein